MTAANDVQLRRRASRAKSALGGVTAGAVSLLSCNWVLGIDQLGTDGCEPRARRCIENTPWVCEGDRTWYSLAPCVDQTCIAGLCVGECAPSEARCKGNTTQTCDANGQWADGVLCQAPEQCSHGACMVACSPGDLRCSGDQPQLCDANGQWRDDGPPCHPCTGCDPDIAACAASPKPDGASCLDPNKCTLTATCQGGQCVAKSSVVCIEGGCSSGTCDPATGSCDVKDGTSCDGGESCGELAVCKGGVCNPGADHAWAHWDVTQAPPVRYTYTKDSPVTYDNLTHLMWQRTGGGGSVDHDGAKSYCDCLNGIEGPVPCAEIPGYSTGWRLPTRIELASLIDLGIVNPSIDSVAFPDVKANWYWSSTVRADAQGVRAVTVHFGSGDQELQTLDSVAHVRCVR